MKKSELRMVVRKIVREEVAIAIKEVVNVTVISASRLSTKLP